MSGPRDFGRLHALQRAFAAHLRDPGSAPPIGVDACRMAVYVDLFYNNIERLLATNFPVIRTLHDKPSWHARVRDFYREHRSQTPLFSEISIEFIAWLQQRADTGVDDWPFLAELARHEASELALSLDEHEIAELEHDPNGDVISGVPVPSPLARVHAYRYPVHLIGPDYRPLAAPAQPTLVLLIRNRADAISFLEIDPLSALLIAGLQENRDETGAQCVDAVLAALGRQHDAELRASGLNILKQLRACDAILGTVREGTAPRENRASSERAD